MNTVDVLKRAKSLIEDKGWTQGALARNRAGAHVCPTEHTAKSFCMLGACYAANPHPAYMANATDELLMALPKPYFEVEAFNDAPGRTKEEVLAVFDKAIAAAGRKLAEAV